MTPKQFYRNYLADNELQELNDKLISLIKEENPAHVFEFGCGTGKNLRPLEVAVCGLDVSFLNIIHAVTVNKIPFLIIGDEYHLGHLTNFDVVFTCSVLDHIENVDRVVFELKRIANKCLFIAETNDTPYRYYYPHDYEALGFKKLNFSWVGADGATYYIWKWTK